MNKGEQLPSCSTLLPQIARCECNRPGACPETSVQDPGRLQAHPREIEIECGSSAPSPSTAVAICFNTRLITGRTHIDSCSPGPRCLLPISLIIFTPLLISDLPLCSTALPGTHTLYFFVQPLSFLSPPVRLSRVSLQHPIHIRVRFPTLPQRHKALLLLCTKELQIALLVSGTVQ